MTTLVNELNIEPLCSLSEVARELGISPSGAFQLEQRALKKLANQLSRRGISVDTFLRNADQYSSSDLLAV